MPYPNTYSKQMNVTLIEPFFTGSHQQWAEGLQRYSRHEVSLLKLKGRHWKWRMHGGAVALAQQLQRQPRPDVLLATDMLDVATFLGLARRGLKHLPCLLYFHENQLSYPWSPNDPDVALGRNHGYAFKNYTSALAADAIAFNSQYQMDAFLGKLPSFLGQFPDYRGIANVETIRKKSRVLHLGMDLQSLDKPPPMEMTEAGGPVILWNHRWEYDKNPDSFFRCLFRLQEEGVSFRLVVLGQGFKHSPAIFDTARQRLAKETLHWGYAEDAQTYAQWLNVADLLPVTSRQDFFGAAVVEAIYCGVTPLLPNRLAFPAHIPPHLHDTLLYNEDEGLYQKLKDFCTHPKLFPELRPHLSRYDWSKQIQAYDDWMEASH